MSDADRLKNELRRQLILVSQKWEQRQILEEELGIPTSNNLTKQFIEEESAKIMASYVDKKIELAIKEGGLFGG